VTYDDRPWLKSYDPWVKPEIEIPRGTYTDLLLGAFAEFPNRAALHYMGRTITFGELDLLSSRFAAFLRSAGMGRGNVVAVNLPNIPQFLIAHFGAMRAGATVTGMSPLMTPGEMAYQLADSSAKVLVTLDAIFEKRFLKIAGETPCTHVVAAGIGDYLPPAKRVLGRLLKKFPTGVVSPIEGKTVRTFMDVMSSHKPDKTAAASSPDDVCLIQYTGGTTGMPKGAVLTHGNIAANIAQVTQWLNLERGKETYCFGFPFFHLAGLALGMATSATGNTQILIPNPRDTRHICREMAHYRPQGTGNVPSLYQMLMDDPAFRKLDFSRMRLCGSGAAPFPEESLRALEAVVKPARVVEAYGMTEASPFITFNPVLGPGKIGSVGVPIQSTRVRIVDLDTGTKDVPIGAEGELICNGPQVMRGYHNKPSETENTLRMLDGERWLYTGDVVRMNSDGFIFLIDRAKDMLNVSGFKVFSREVEEKLYQHPAIAMCAIVGVPNPDRPGSELVKLVVQLSEQWRGRDPAAVREEITAFCHENMAPYKVPKFIEFTDALPLTVVGKVDKKALR
jgi:acyl-CoA synthetase (AMP-forming)/AMP-acid ligase II